MNLEEMRQKKGRVRLDDDLADLVSGGISADTVQWIATSYKEHWSQEYFVEFVDYVRNEYGNDVFSDMFGGDTYEEVIGAHDKFFRAAQEAKDKAFKAGR